MSIAYITSQGVSKSLCSWSNGEVFWFHLPTCFQRITMFPSSASTSWRQRPLTENKTKNAKTWKTENPQKTQLVFFQNQPWQHHDNKSLDSQLSQMGNPKKGHPSPRSSVWSPPQRSRNLRHGRLSYTFRCMFSKHLKKKGLAVTQTRFYMILYQPAFAQTSFYTD